MEVEVALILLEVVDVTLERTLLPSPHLRSLERVGRGGRGSGGRERGRGRGGRGGRGDSPPRERTEGW